jgi:hypothetical protein
MSLEQAGVPSIAVHTHVFARLAQATARAAGKPLSALRGLAPVSPWTRAARAGKKRIHVRGRFSHPTVMQ